MQSPAPRAWLRLSHLTILGLALAACDSGDAGAKQADEAKSATTEGAKTEGPEAKAPATKAPATKAPSSKTGVSKALAHDKGPTERKAPKLAADEAKSKAEQFKSAMKAGRDATQAKKYDDAIASFEAALKLDPNHPGALGELGWALFRKGDLDRAHAETMKAMSHVKSPARKGALLYNLGRIEEAQGKVEHALDLYHRSLSVRENEVVAKRVAELEAELSAANAPPPPPTYASIDALCEAELLDLVLCPEEGDEDGECGCSAEKTIQNPSPDAVIKSAAIISVGSFGTDMGLEEYGYLAIETTSRGWQLVNMVGDGSEPGISYIHNAWTLQTFEFVEIEGGGAPELAVSVERMESDGDYGSNAMEFADWTDMWLCYEDKPAARCVMFEIASEVGLDKMLDDGDTPDPDEWGPLGSHQYTLEVSFAEGKVNLTDVGGDAQERATNTGSFTLAELADASWTERIELH